MGTGATPPPPLLLLAAFFPPAAGAAVSVGPPPYSGTLLPSTATLTVRRLLRAW
jgi:hypothetical protein